MTRFATALSRSLDPKRAVEELAEQIDRALHGPDRLAGGLILATAAAGGDAMEVARGLSDRSSHGPLFGTSFEGILADGRVFRDEPAIAVLAWSEGPFSPVPLVFEAGELEASRIAQTILDAAGRRELTPADLALLFPDSLGSPQIERVLNELAPLLGGASLAGSAAAGLEGRSAQAFLGGEALPGALLGLFVPGSGKGTRPIVRCAGATLSVSPWLEITRCRSRWIDGLDGEPPLDWVRRQLRLEAGSPVEPHLGRLLVRIQRPSEAGSASVVGEGKDTFYEERYVIGVDDDRGSVSIAGTPSLGDELAFALPDPEHAREALRDSLDELAESGLLLQFACRARDEALYGDPDLDSAWVAHHASSRQILGTVSPFQLARSRGGIPRLLVHSTVLAAVGGR